MLRGFTDQDFDWWLRRVSRAGFDSCLYGIAQQLADDILQMAEDVREGGLQMAFDFDVRKTAVRTISFARKRDNPLPARFNDLLTVTAKEHLTNQIGIGVHVGLSVGEMPWGIEGLGQGKMLLCYDTARDAL